MIKRITAFTLLAGLTLVGLLAVGCGPDTELGGAPIPNREPDTRVTARPPDLLEGSFVVEFFWTGTDVDGKVAGYQWKVSSNGLDGISVQDTLTFDPVTGDTLNPWHFTVSTDSSFLVTADIPEFPGDPEGFNRSYQTHSFWVRAIDEDGAVDPTPAYISFTSTTLLPKASISGPERVKGQNDPRLLPPTVTFLYDGIDPDFDLGTPTKVRFLWKRALINDDVGYADSRVEVVENLDFLASFDDSSWTEWRRFAVDEDERRVSFENQPRLDEAGRRILYLFVVQAQDTAGAVSIERSYGVNMAHVRITNDNPYLRVVEPFLGQFTAIDQAATQPIDIAAGQELNFSWVADADAYAGEIESYRYGWDVADVNDPGDPGWALLPGNSPQHRRSPTQSFPSGSHTLTIVTRDNSSQVTQLQVRLNVVPVPDTASQFPLLLVDDVYDQNSNAWGGQDGRPLDNDTFRDAFWENTLLQSGGVVRFNPSDIVDTEDEDLTYRTAVQYKVILFTSRWVTDNRSLVDEKFRPLSFDVDQFNWLSAYQSGVGNLMMCASRAMDNFLLEANYALPIVFESREGGLTGVQDGVRVGFGEREMPDGSVIQLGPTRYPYQTIGLSVVDQVSPTSAYTIYGSDPVIAVKDGRKAPCTAVKAVVLDTTFIDRHMSGSAPFLATIGTEPTIDWRDAFVPGYYDTLTNPYVWGNTEYYEYAGRRTTPYEPQECELGPDQLCIEPMFRSQARFDWIREQHLEADPDDDWPVGYYTQPLRQLCGRYALDLSETSAVTDGRTVGFLSYKTAPTKPTQYADVIWGFDPYRFDHEEMRKAIQWVLGEHFNLPMRP